MEFSITDIPLHLLRGSKKLVRNPREWFLLVGDRLVLAGGLTGVFCLCVLALITTGIVAVQTATTMIYLFSTLAAGNITLITIVLSINQLVISRQLKTPGELETHIENVIEYRTEVEQQSPTAVAPVTPSDFLDVLLSNAQRNAYQAASNATDQADSPLATEVDAVTTQITRHTEHIQDLLERSQTGIFSALAVALETNYSEQLNEVHRLKFAHREELSPATKAALDDLAESLRQIDVARQYFKTVYIEDELARLSRILLYIGIPTVGSSILLLLVYSAPSPLTAVGGILPELVLVTTTLGFVPLTLLFSFLLRVATVAKRTAAITPFTTPEQEADSG